MRATPCAITLAMPALTAGQADAVADLVDTLQMAVWQVYGDQILDLAFDQAAQGDPGRPPPSQPPLPGDRRGLSRRPPKPPEIARSPELAVLAALDAALLVTDYALLAEHPDLWDQDRPPWCPPPDLPARIADTIIDLAHRLRDTLACYRRALEKRDQDSRRDEIPF